MDENNRITPPFARVCIRNGKLTLNRWNPRLIRGGPMAMNMRTVRACLADLFLVDGDELIVEPVAHSRFTDEDAEAVTAWARSVGYSRLWLPGHVIELDGEPAGGEAKVRCRTCGARWEDASHNFWLRVRDSGHFPGHCPACGDSLPEWEVAEPPTDSPAGEQAQLDLQVEARRG
jgi:hypothetical protein